MSDNNTTTFLLRLCMERQEPCVPDVHGESWFSVKFAAEVMGFEHEYFTRKINEHDVPRHPLQRQCIRFSDTAKTFEGKEGGNP